MKVLVLGSNGFIGSEVIESLLHNKCTLGITKIVGIDKQQDKIEKIGNQQIPAVNVYDYQDEGNDY